MSKTCENCHWCILTRDSNQARTTSGGNGTGEEFFDKMGRIKGRCEIEEGFDVNGKSNLRFLAAECTYPSYFKTRQTFQEEQQTLAILPRSR